MDRRSFMKMGLLAGLALVLPQAPAALARPASPAAPGLQEAKPSTIAGAPQTRFGPDVTVADLRQENGVWYAQLEQQGRSFWLKSYNGRVWGTPDWQPGRNSSARK